MMKKQDFDDHLYVLGLSYIEAAQLLGVSSRTVSRWLEGEDVPGPAEAALRAWRKLSERHLAWMPDSVSIFEDDQTQIQLMAKHAEELAELLEKVSARGGAKEPWSVDISRGTAIFGQFRLGFYKLANGGFSPSYYRRLDKSPDLVRDREIFEDAVFCIAAAFERTRKGSQALESISKYTRDQALTNVTNRHAALDATNTDQRKKMIETLADQFDELAIHTLKGLGTYAQFETILNKLHAVSIFPEISLVSDVARNMI
jgi:transcriptional regulator with XRE-family HTH domain